MRARRVVSLVPSLTESVASVDADALVGVTDWCTHPAGLDAARVRGTKNPDVARIVALAPDVVLANKEENRRVDVERLRDAGVRVWISEIDSLAEAFAELRAMFADVLGWGVPGWLPDAERAFGVRRPVWATAAVPIWRDPWLVVGGRTFTGDVLAHLGVANAFGHLQRYPRVELDAIRAAELVILPDEPYAFSAADADECLPSRPVELVSGRLLTWYGPSLLDAAALFEDRRDGLLSEVGDQRSDRHRDEEDRRHHGEDDQ